MGGNAIAIHIDFSLVAQLEAINDSVGLGANLTASINFTIDDAPVPDNETLGPSGIAAYYHSLTSSSVILASSDNTITSKSDVDQVLLADFFMSTRFHDGLNATSYLGTHDLGVGVQLPTDFWSASEHPRPAPFSSIDWKVTV